MNDSRYRFEAKNDHFQKLFENPNLKWLGQNTNHFPAPAAVKETLIQAVADEAFHLYGPPGGLRELREGIVADLGLANADVACFVTDGAISGLYHICHVLCRPRELFLAADPGWRWPLNFAASQGAYPVEIPIYSNESGYRLSPDRLREAVTKDTGVIYLVDPNNPLGSTCSREEIAEIAAIARDSGAYLVHDCTYRHFADDHTLAHEFYPEGTLTTYSFSKWLGLAGLRVGGVVAAREIIERLAEAPPNNLGSNVLSQRAALAGLGIKGEWFPEVNSRQRANQERIRNAVASVAGLEMPVYPSQANFVSIDVTGAGIEPAALCDVYLDAEILIRHAGYHSERFADRFVKVSTTVPEPWIEEFCALLPEMVDAATRKRDVRELY